MRLPCWGAICSLLIGWAPVFADQPAETLPGFHPENLLEAHGIDNVNLFNGDPGVVIPLGPEYIGGPSYRWQLKAYYSAKLWTMSTCDLENDTGQAAWVRGDPTLGAGWTMQVGYVETQYYLADQTTAFSWTYVSPDGGRHEVFFGTGTVAYTLDATRLRVTVSPTAAHPTQYTVEFRDGSIQTLSHISGPPLPSPPSSSPDFRNIGYPSPVEKRFGLTSVQDSFRNTVLSVGYDSTYPDEVTTVTLTPNTQSKAVTFHWKAMTIGTATWRVMDYVEFDTVSGQKQRATFGQQSGTFPRNNFDRGPSGCFATGASVQVPELSSVTFSDPATSPSFPSFSHSFTYWPDASGDQIPVQRQGALWQLTLPTGGTITYEYGSTTQNQCEIVSAGNCDPETSYPVGPLGPGAAPDAGNPGPRFSAFLDKSAAVTKRTAVDPVGGTTSVTTYVRSQFFPDDGHNNPDTDRIIRRTDIVSPGNDQGTLTNYLTRHFFHVAYLNDSDVQHIDGGLELDRRIYPAAISSDSPLRTVISCYGDHAVFGSGPICGYRDSANDKIIQIYGFDDLPPQQASVTWFTAPPATEDGGTCTTVSSVSCKGSSGTNLDPTARRYGKISTTTNLPGIAGWSSRDEITAWTPQQAPEWILDIYSSKTVTDNGTPPAPASVATTYSFNLGNGFLNSYSTTDATYGSLTHTFTPDAVGNSQAASMTGTGGVSTTTFTDTRSFQSGTPAKQWFLPVSVQRSGITWKSFDVDREANTSAIVTSRDANSTLVTTYNYDALGRIKTITPPGGASPEAPTTIAYADTTHTTVTRTGSDGNGTFQEYVYDGLGRISREIRQMPSGYALRLHKYDKANHPYFVSEWNACASVTPPTGNCLTLSPAGGTTQSSFDPFDRPETITKADGTVTTINRTDGTILKSDTREAVTEVVSGSNATTARRRDVLGRIVSVSEPAVNGVATVTSYLYDVLDKVNCVKQDGTGQGTTTCSNNPSGQYRWFQHDAFGFLRSETTPERGNSAVTYGPYDALGDALTELEPGSLTITRVFDAAGRLQKVTSASLVYVRNCYDGTGVTCIDGITNSSGGNFPKGKVSRRYSYNPASSPAGTLQEDFTYSNTAGRLSGKTLAFGGGLTLSASQGWLYNSLGLVSSRTHPIPPPTGGTFSVDTTYSAGLPTQVKNGASNVATNIGYDPSGGLATWTAANGVVTAVTQDTSLLPRPRQIKTTGAIPTASNLDTGIYAYDGAGNLLSIGADQFTYDGRSRLSTTSYSGTGTESYQYDGYGNMLSKSQTAGTTTNWTFCTTTCTNNQMQAASGYGYDARGNLTTNVNETLTYDGLNRQWRDQSPGGGDWTYIYDGTGQRVAKVTGGAATYTLRDEGNRFVTEFAGPTLGRDNVYLGNLLVASRVWDAGSGTVGWNYYHSDHLGTPRLVTDSSHNVVESPRKYWPFGAGISTNPATMQRTRFAAMEVDREATRYYDHARHHETVVSRFVSPDLIGGAVAEPASWNRYVYAHSNPLRLIDPDGKDVFDAVRFINNTGLGTIAARVNAAIAALKEAGGHTFGIFKEWKTSATKAGAELLLRVGLSTDLETRTAKARLEVNTTVGGRGTYVEASTKVVENGQFLPDGAHVELERGVVVGHENVSTSGEVTRTDSVGPFAIENSVDVPKAEEAIGNMVSASVDAAAAVAAGIENKAFQPCGTGAKPEQPCPR